MEGDQTETKAKFEDFLDDLGDQTETKSSRLPSIDKIINYKDFFGEYPINFEERMKRIPVEPLLIAKIERDNMISELRSFGLQVGDWKYGDNVNTALQEI